LKSRKKIIFENLNFSNVLKIGKLNFNVDPLIFLMLKTHLNLEVWKSRKVKSKDAEKQKVPRRKRSFHKPSMRKAKIKKFEAFENFDDFQRHEGKNMRLKSVIGC